MTEVQACTKPALIISMTNLFVIHLLFPLVLIGYESLPWQFLSFQNLLLSDSNIDSTDMDTRTGSSLGLLKANSCNHVVRTLTPLSSYSLWGGHHFKWQVEFSLCNLLCVCCALVVSSKDFYKEEFNFPWVSYNSQGLMHQCSLCLDSNLSHWHTH